MYGKPKRDPVRSRSRSSFFVVSFYYLFFPPPFSRGRWRRRRVSGRYLTTTDVNSFARAQNRSLYSFELYSEMMRGNTRIFFFLLLLACAFCCAKTEEAEPQPEEPAKPPPAGLGGIRRGQCRTEYADGVFNVRTCGRRGLE